MGDYMQSNFDNFREFIKDKEYLQKKVKQGKTSWQELYEHYDLFGEDDEIFKNDEEKQENNEERSNEKDSSNTEKKDDASMASLFTLLSGLDVDKISDGLNGMKKVLNILSEVTKQDENVTFSRRKQSRPYQKEDD